MDSSNKQLTPLQQLRAEKRQLKKQYTAEGERLAQNWDYLSNNVGSIFFNTVLGSAKGLIGGNTKLKESIPTPFGQSNSLHAVFSGLTASLPVIWEIAQPMLIGFFVKKIKNFFFSKKKKKLKKKSDGA